MLGDVTGIGAEIAAKMLATQEPKAIAGTVLVGDARHLALGCRESGAEVPAYAVVSVAAFRMAAKLGAAARRRND